MALVSAAPLLKRMSLVTNSAFASSAKVSVASTDSPANTRARTLLASPASPARPACAMTNRAATCVFGATRAGKVSDFSSTSPATAVGPIATT